MSRTSWLLLGTAILTLVGAYSAEDPATATPADTDTTLSGLTTATVDG